MAVNQIVLPVGLITIFAVASLSICAWADDIKNAHNAADLHQLAVAEFPSIQARVLELGCVDDATGKFYKPPVRDVGALQRFLANGCVASSVSL